MLLFYHLSIEHYRQAVVAAMDGSIKLLPVRGLDVHARVCALHGHREGDAAPLVFFIYVKCISLPALQRRSLHPRLLNAPAGCSGQGDKWAFNHWPTEQGHPQVRGSGQVTLSTCWAASGVVWCGLWRVSFSLASLRSLDRPPGSPAAQSPRRKRGSHPETWIFPGKSKLSKLLVSEAAYM